ncbi:MAG: ABC transporter substrate-binding protein [Treponema sp.]|jgi:peptide/nickel transport system substrate-binding protein|nr:ABC transporter substrate-binding protein [Treponema sp.]
MKTKQPHAKAFCLTLALFLAIAPAGLYAGGNKARSSGGVSGSAELRFGLMTEPSTLDPLSPSNTADGRSVLFNVFEGLLKPDTEGNVEPAAAEKFSLNESGRVYTFTLREGLLFHNGKPVSSADAAFTIRAAIDAQFADFSLIDRIDTPDSRTIRITLKSPDPEFLSNLTIGIVPKDNPDRERNPVGTGPFIIESYTAQQNLVLVKNPNYWKKGYPKLDKVTVVFSSGSDALLLGLQGGNFDGATIPGSLLPQLDRNRFDVFPGYSASIQLLALNNSVKPLDDPRIRQAINYGIDIQEIIDAAFYGEGEGSGSPLIPGLVRSYETSLKNPYPINIEKAKSLLREAGYPNGFNLEITVPSVYVMHVDTAQVMVNQLSKIGVNASIKLVDWAAWLSGVYRGRQFQSTVISLDANSISPRAFLSRYRSDSGSNFINYKNPAYDRTYDLCLTEINDQRRAALYKEAQRIVSSDAASVYIQDILGFKVFTKGRFSGVLNYPLYVIDFSTIELKQ